MATAGASRSKICSSGSPRLPKTSRWRRRSSVDRSLWLLLRLRVGAWFRRVGRSLRSTKGILLTLIALAMFLPWMLALALVPAGVLQVFVPMVRRIGPAVLFLFVFLNFTLGAAGERAISF